MRIELGVLLGSVLSGILIIAFFLECCKNRQTSKLKKNIHLERRKCEVCSSVYFVSLLFEFWHCPLCGSINKEDSAAKM